MRPLPTGHEERPGRVFIGLDVIGHLWSNNGWEQKNKRKNIVDIVLRQSAQVEEESKAEGGMVDAEQLCEADLGPRGFCNNVRSSCSNLFFLFELNKTL